MRKTGMIILIMMLAGCGGTSLSQYHTSCMNIFPDFPNQLACVHNNIAQDPYRAQDTLTREYLLTGDMLLADMRAGRISEDQARLEFLRKLNQVKAAELDQMARESYIRREMDWRFPRHTTCHPLGGSLQCTTF